MEILVQTGLKRMFAAPGTLSSPLWVKTRLRYCLLPQFEEQGSAGRNASVPQGHPTIAQHFNAGTPGAFSVESDKSRRDDRCRVPGRQMSAVPTGLARCSSISVPAIESLGYFRDAAPRLWDRLLRWHSCYNCLVSGFVALSFGGASSGSFSWPLLPDLARTEISANAGSFARRSPFACSWPPAFTLGRTDPHTSPS